MISEKARTIIKNILLLTFITYLFYFVVVKFYIFPNHSGFGAQIILSIENEKKFSDLKDVDYLVLGDSSAFKNIIPDYLSSNSYSLALPGGSTMDIYHRLSRLDLNKIKKGIVITNSFIAPKHYARDYWDRMVLFGFYDFNEFMRNYEIGVEHKVFPSNYNKAVYILFYLKSKMLLSVRGLQALWYAPASFQKKKSMRKKLEEKFWKQKGWLDNPEGIRSPLFFKAYHTHYNRRFNSDPTDHFYFNKILKLTEEKKIPVYFVQGPLAERGYPLIDVEDYKTSLAEYMHGLRMQYPHFHYYQSRLKLQPKAFFDFYHLSDKGAEKFTKEIAGYIEANP